MSQTARSLEEAVEIANPQHPHCPVVLVLDVSSSMSGDKIRQLNEGVRFFRDDVATDELARKRVDVAVVTFGSTVDVAHTFSGVEGLADPAFRANGSTPMGEAVLRAIELVRDRKAAYRSMGTDHYRPWIFLVTDGEPTDMSPGDATWSRVAGAIRSGEDAREFLFFAVGVEPADMHLLAQLASPERPPARLRPGKFKEMFAWLSASQRRVSASRVGEQIALPPAGWAEIPTS